MGAVNYVPRKINVVNRQTPSRPSKSFSTIDLFTKNDSFQKDSEVRYVFLEYSNAKKTEFSSLNTDGELIECPALIHFLAGP